MKNKLHVMQCGFMNVLLLVVLSNSVAAYDYFLEGEKLFRENKPDQAISLLFQASQAPGTDSKVFLYLGICYQQSGKYADAISTFMKGSSVAGSDRKLMFFNAGNVYYLQDQFNESETMYSRAVEIDSAWAPAYLNRANARVRQSKLTEAVADYRQYLVLDPATWQRSSVQQLIDLLSGEVEIAKNEQVRAEANRLAAAAEKAAAEERYKKLLDEVSSSLQAVDSASTLSAGSESVMEYQEEGQLE